MHSQVVANDLVVNKLIILGIKAVVFGDIFLAVALLEGGNKILLIGGGHIGGNGIIPFRAVYFQGNIHGFILESRSIVLLRLNIEENLCADGVIGGKFHRYFFFVETLKSAEELETLQNYICVDGGEEKGFEIFIIAFQRILHRQIHPFGNGFCRVFRTGHSLAGKCAQCNKSNDNKA